MSKIISTDHPLTDADKANLRALLNTLIPPSNDGVMPGAGTVDLLTFMDNPLDPEFETSVRHALSELGSEFAMLGDEQRTAQVTALQETAPEVFTTLYMQTLAVYYRQDAVLRGIGSREGPPFPRGNEVIDGDMSLLDPVVAKPKHYRPA